jgi:hypothetical protein
MRNELDVSIMHLVDIMKHEDWLVSYNSTLEGTKHPANAQEKSASAYEFILINMEQKTKGLLKKEHYVPIAKEAWRKLRYLLNILLCWIFELSLFRLSNSKAREEEYKNSKEAAAYEKMRINAA